MLLSEKILNEMSIGNNVKHVRRKLLGPNRAEERMLNQRAFEVKNRKANRLVAETMLRRAKQHLNNALQNVISYTTEADLHKYLLRIIDNDTSTDKVLMDLYTISIYADEIQSDDAEIIKQYCETAKLANTDAFGNLSYSVARLCDAIIYQFS